MIEYYQIVINGKSMHSIISELIMHPSRFSLLLHISPYVNPLLTLLSPSPAYLLPLLLPPPLLNPSLSFLTFPPPSGVYTALLARCEISQICVVCVCVCSEGGLGRGISTSRDMSGLQGSIVESFLDFTTQPLHFHTVNSALIAKCIGKG